MSGFDAAMQLHARMRNERRAMDAQSFEPMNRLRSTLIRIAAVYVRKRRAMDRLQAEGGGGAGFERKLASLQAERSNLKDILHCNQLPMEHLFGGAPIEEIATLPLLKDSTWRALEEEVRG